LNIAYTLNATGNRTARAESFAGATRREAYGAIDQLIETRLNPAGTANERRVGYVYDAAGNRTRVVEDADGTGPGSAQERVYSANALNQYTAISGLAAPLHDIDGNTTLLQSGARLWSYQYDAQNRLVSGTDGTTTFQFHYDARNRCVSRVINGEPRYLTYDGWSLLEDRDGAGRLSAKHLHGGSVDEVLATVTPAGARYLHQDGLGNVVALTDGSGAMLERVRYDAYGQPEHLTATGAVSGVSPTGNRFLFTGREWFSELGLQDNRHRYYHPGIGRWLSRDPIGERGGLNLYAYAGNSPTAFTDPFGLTSKCPPCPSCEKLHSGCSKAVNEDFLVKSTMWRQVRDAYLAAVDDWKGREIRHCEQKFGVGSIGNDLCVLAVLAIAGSQEANIWITYRTGQSLLRSKRNFGLSDCDRNFGRCVAERSALKAAGGCK
jgi:RHS repeat-associated protein